jgi:hypothetical protein
VAIIALHVPPAAYAQSAPADTLSGSPPVSVSCDGMRVSRIDITSGRPVFGGTMSRWRHFARAIGLHHTTTRDGVIAAFVALHVGEPCTELRRAESERVLRAQPFLASASVKTVADGPGQVAVLVDTRDEAPVLVNARFHGIRPEAFSLGNGNIGGEGLLAEVRMERGYNYRTGIGGRVTDYATFGRPYVATVEGERQTIGYWLDSRLEHPFFTELQRLAWHLEYGTGHGYFGIVRPARDAITLGVRQDRWDASTITRLFGTTTVLLLGVGFSGVHIVPDTAGTVIADTGATADTGRTLLNRYRPLRAGRLAVLGGVRRLTYKTVRGFDALTAEQDVANGVAGGVFVGHGLAALGEADFFLSGAAYAGKATEHTLLAAMTIVEGRRPLGRRDWDGIVGSSRAAFYAGGGPGFMLLADDQYSLGVRPKLPMQLWLGDWRGGVIGYHSSTIAGERRNVSHAELRWTGQALVRNADVGFATFTQVGTVWAGNSPYGVTATRAAIGLSVMAAYPTGSKRLYRADVGFPVLRGRPGGGGIEVRFTSEDRTQTFWREPDDVQRSRTGSTPWGLFTGQSQ